MEDKFLYQKVYKFLLKNIEDGLWISGNLIPKESELLSVYSIGRDTLRKALDRLKREGYLYSKSGLGTYVKRHRLDYKLSLMYSFTEIAKSQGKVSRSIILKNEKLLPNDYIANKLNLDNNEKVYYISRLRLAGNSVLCYEDTYINAQLCKGLDKEINTDTSLYKLYENKYNLKLSHGDYTIEAINSNKKISDILGIKENSAILFMKATVYINNSKPLYTVLAYYIGSEYVFSTTMKRNTGINF